MVLLLCSASFHGKASNARVNVLKGPVVQIFDFIHVVSPRLDDSRGTAPVQGKLLAGLVGVLSHEYKVTFYEVREASLRGRTSRVAAMRL